LIRTHGSAEKSLLNVNNHFPYQKAEKILNAFKGKVLLATDPNFPKELRRSSSCPPMLFAIGNLSLLNSPKVAIIGARNASINGKSIANRMGEDLSNYFVIVSGLAVGIDASAHLGSGPQKAIAVMPFSLENVYPKENYRLFQEITKEGLAISEVSPHRTPEQSMFHARNRTIAMLSIGIVVIEAGIKSGTMEASKMALDLGVEVMAVPGSPTDPRARGCNHLIKNGAPLIENFMDVLETLGYKISEEQANPLKKTENTYNDVSTKIISMLSMDTPVYLETIASNLNVNIQDILCNISELEILGKIRKCSTNEVMLNAQF
jgi:DNA processing protein